MSRKLKFWKNFWMSFPGFSNKAKVLDDRFWKVILKILLVTSGPKSINNRSAIIIENEIWVFVLFKLWEFPWIFFAGIAWQELRIKLSTSGNGNLVEAVFSIGGWFTTLHLTNSGGGARNLPNQLTSNLHYRSMSLRAPSRVAIDHHWRIQKRWKIKLGS